MATNEEKAAAAVVGEKLEEALRIVGRMRNAFALIGTGLDATIKAEREAVRTAEDPVQKGVHQAFLENLVGLYSFGQLEPTLRKALDLLRTSFPGG